MSKFCEKCGKEIPQSSKKDVCESCQNKTYGKGRKIGEGILAVVGIIAFVVVKLLKE